MALSYDDSTINIFVGIIIIIIIKTKKINYDLTKYTYKVMSTLLISFNLLCALEVIFNEMHYINLRFTHLLTYLLCKSFSGALGYTSSYC